MNDSSNFDVTPSNERHIGEIIRRMNNISADQVAEILKYQRDNGVKFGEAAVALGLARREDILWALSQQFSYQYTNDANHPGDGSLVVASNPFSEVAELFRDLRSQLISSVFDHQPLSKKSLAIVSPEVGDGKSFVAANLAIAFSQLGARTLLVDADMRTPTQSQLFGLKPSGGGLSGILSGRNESSLVRPIIEIETLFLLPVGVVPPNPLELVQQQGFSQLLADLSSTFDHIVIDTPAVSHGVDAKVIAAKAGAALMVARSGHSRTAALSKLSASLKRSNVKVAGVLLNDH